MLIHPPETSTTGPRKRVTARIETPHSALRGLGELWFEVDGSDAEGLSDRSDAFFVAALPLAMSIGERLEVRGRVSPLLARGAREYQWIVNGWWPRQMQIVDIQFDSLEPPADTAAGVAAVFSGGVDSFYTLLRHRRAEELIPPLALTHALVVNGFDLDVDLDETGHFAALREIYEPLLKRLGIELVVMRTNLRKFRLAGLTQGGLYNTFGTSLIASALALGRLLGRVYITGATPYRQLVTDGAHPLTSPLLSTEATVILHDGADATRVEKTTALAGWPETWSRLRVCWNPGWRNIDPASRRVVNCGRCDKCVRTMTTLELLSVLDHYQTFPHHLSRSAIRRSHTGSKALRQFALENLRLAVERGRRDIAFDVRWSLFRSRVGKLVRWLRRAS